MAKFVILEGIDHIGKSTFAEKYCSMLESAGMNVVKISRKMMTSFADRSNEFLTKDIFEVRHIGALDAYANMFHTLKENNMLGDNDVYVLDRFHPSEYAYGKATRIESFERVFKNDEQFMRYTGQFEKELENIFGQENVFLFIFALSRKSEPIDDEYVNKEELKAVNHSYINYGHLTKLTNCHVLYLEMHQGKSDIMETLNEIFDLTTY